MMQIESSNKKFFKFSYHDSLTLAFSFYLHLLAEIELEHIQILEDYSSALMRYTILHQVILPPTTFLFKKKKKIQGI